VITAPEPARDSGPADLAYHARRAGDLAEEALRPGLRARRAHLLAAVAQVHATLAAAAPPTAGPPTAHPPAAHPPAAAPSAAAPSAAAPSAAEPRARPARIQRRRTGPAPRGVAPAAVGATLFDRLKGQDGIAQAIQEFYTRVLSDPQLEHYFEGVPMWRLQRHMVAFLVQATGGPAGYEGREMEEAHAHLRITARDFDRVARHLVETLTDYGIADADVDEVVAAIGPLRPHIVTAIFEPPPSIGP
jgi:hemoglobin